MVLACLGTGLVGLVGMTGVALRGCGSGLVSVSRWGATALQLAVNDQKDREKGTENPSA